MRPLSPLLTTAALVAASLATLPAAGAAGETCQGRPATVVGAPGQRELRGTEGPDVIVTNDASYVWALGGDDLVCITGTNWQARIDAGEGADSVDATGARAGSTTVLGAGADRFTGSSFGESVTAGTDTTPSLDTETDVIETRGDYDDLVASGQTGTANPDRISLSRGALSWLGVPTPTSLLDGGRYSRLVLELDAPGRAVLDNRAGTLTREGAPTLAFTGFTGFTVRTVHGSGPFEFLGSDTSEQLDLTAWRFLSHRAQMAGGSDRVLIRSNFGMSETSYDGGAGARDVLGLAIPRQEEVDLDLARGKVTTGWGDQEWTTTARGFEGANVAAQRVDLIGTGTPNSFQVDACRARVEGLGGSDRISAYREPADRPVRCSSRRMTVLGGPGHDAMRGTAGPDRLVGGPGRDEAQGRQGRDVCEAEERHGCEVRR